jgi:hypothetical protein
LVCCRKVGTAASLVWCRKEFHRNLARRDREGKVLPWRQINPGCSANKHCCSGHCANSFKFSPTLVSQNVLIYCKARLAVRHTC